jgi:hypothetical protein
LLDSSFFGGSLVRPYVWNVAAAERSCEVTAHEVAGRIQKASIAPAYSCLSGCLCEKTLAVREEALLLSRDGSPLESGNLAKALHFFGVPWRAVTLAEFLNYNNVNHKRSPRIRVFCSSETFLGLAAELRRARLPHWQEHIHSVFVYAGDDPAVLRNLVRILSGEDVGVVSKLNRGAADFVVSDELNDFCGVMAGLRVAASKEAVQASLLLNTRKKDVLNVISTDQGAAFLKLEYNKVPVFLSTSKSIIDIDAKLTTQNFDVRDHFLSTVPVVLYIKWAFGGTCWSAPETNACLVIDDPVLKSTHGFVNFQELLSLMKRHNFSTNIAFIPWNWRRSTPEVVRLFRENPENYSISVHGCDHTRAEFGSLDRQRLYWKAQQALERMNRHESITGIRHDRVMVFPQGIFSEAAMSALKHTDLIAAVNNDVVCAGSHPCAITFSDVWDIAVMRYSNFPLFTRRYPWEGIENFAFDALLGKPVIIIIHHDYCSDHCKRLVDFVDRLNALKCRLTWRSLGEVVRRSCRQRKLSPGVMEVEMYATQLQLENQSRQRKRYLIRRRESEPPSIKEIRANSRNVPWSLTEGRVAVEIELNPGENTTISMGFRDLAGNGRHADTLSYRTKTMLRRYLCEVRDNYIVKSKLRLSGLFGHTSKPPEFLISGR